MRKLMVAFAATVAAAFGAFADDAPAEPSWTTNGTVITVYVPKGQTFSQTTALSGGSIKQFLKTGEGTLVLSQNSVWPHPKGWDIQVREGVLHQKSRQVFGDTRGGNTITVKSGATLHQEFYTNSTDPAIGGYNDVVIEGTGYEGMGALKNTHGTSQNPQRSHFYNLTLSGDALMTGDGTCGVARKLDLAGHTLTINQTSGAKFVLGGGMWSGSDPNDQSKWTDPSVVTAGNIDLINTGICFMNRIVYEGDFSSCRISLDPNKGIEYYNLLTPQKFPLYFTKATGAYSAPFYVSSSLKNGEYYEGANVQAGSITFTGGGDYYFNTPNATTKQCATFAGKLTFPNAVGSFGGYSGNGNLRNFTCFLENDDSNASFVFYTGHWVARTDGCLGRSPSTASISLSQNSNGEKPGFLEMDMSPGRISAKYAAYISSRIYDWTNYGVAEASFGLYASEAANFAADFPASTQTGYTKIPYRRTGSGTLTMSGDLPSERTLWFDDYNTTVFGTAKDQTLYAMKQFKGEVLLPKDAVGKLSATNKSVISNGCVTIVGGELNVKSGSLRGGAFPGAKSMFYQLGGKFTTSGNNLLFVSDGGDGEYLMRGGSFTSDGQITLGEKTYSDYKDLANGSGVFTMQEGNPQVTLPNALVLNERSNGFNAIININSGVLTCTSVRNLYNSGMDCVTNGHAYVNFNGGTYRAYTGDASSGSASYPLFGYYGNDAPTAVTVWNGTFDIPDATWHQSLSAYGNSCQNENMCIKSPTGRGLASVTLPDNMPRTGYHGVLPVSVKGGGGTCATVALDYDPETGTVADELIITCPGWDYTSVPTITALGSDGLPYQCIGTLTETEQDSGVFYKVGPGELNLNTKGNQFAGVYVVSNGTIRIPRWADIPAYSRFFLAGGAWKGDWHPGRTIAKMGGYGTFEMYPNNGDVNNLTITDALTFDAKDLAAGRGPLTYVDDGNSGKDHLYFGAGIKVEIANLNELQVGCYDLLVSPSATIPSVPQLDAGDADTTGWKVRLASSGHKLQLVKTAGMAIMIW